MPKRIIAPFILRDTDPVAMPINAAIKKVTYLNDSVVAYAQFNPDEPKTTYRRFAIVRGEAWFNTDGYKYLKTLPTTSAGTLHIYEKLPLTKEQQRTMEEQAFRTELFSQVKLLREAVFGPDPSGLGTPEQIDAERRAYEARKLAILDFAQQRITQDFINR